MDERLSREDYEETCGCGGSLRIPVDRVIRKLDEYTGSGDLAGAESHLAYWLTEARNAGDKRGMLALLNEQTGLYRRMEKREEALKAASDAIGTAQSMGLSETPSMATTLINAATACKSFGRAEEALPLYERALAIYEAKLEPDDVRIAGLCNNMGITVTGTGDFERAAGLFRRALDILSRIPGGENEMAITWCNIADLAAARYGMLDAEEPVGKCLERAKSLLDTEGLAHDGYHAFVCEKCAPVFGYYGYFMAEKELRRRAEDIHAGN